MHDKQKENSFKLTALWFSQVFLVLVELLAFYRYANLFLTPYFLGISLLIIGNTHKLNLDIEDYELRLPVMPVASVYMSLYSALLIFYILTGFEYFRLFQAIIYALGLFLVLFVLNLIFSKNPRTWFIFAITNTVFSIFFILFYIIDYKAELVDIFFVKLIAYFFMMLILSYYLVIGYLLILGQLSFYPEATVEGVINENKTRLIEEEEAKKNKAKTKLDNADTDKLLHLKFDTDRAKQILEYFENSSAFLDRNFSFDNLLEDLKMSAQDLRELMQDELNVNFYTLIGYFRVKHAIALMQTEPDYITLAAIMRASGFKTRSSFVSHFKQNTGLTPSDYRKILES